MSESKAAVYLIPVPIAEDTLEKVIPSYIFEILQPIQHFAVENIRTARRFIASCKLGIDIEALQFFELNVETSQIAISEMLAYVKQGHSLGVLSESGCPAVADPGSNLVRAAHQKSIQVIPLVGPSSILLALMASGFSGQQFRFHGYLPIRQAERKEKINRLEKESKKNRETQIFIETPYRNKSLFSDLLTTCMASTHLCIAYDITGKLEKIETKTIEEWKRMDWRPEEKLPCMFLLLSH